MAVIFAGGLHEYHDQDALGADCLRPRELRFYATRDMLVHLDRDLELDFIREFAAGGELMKGLSADDRRERIRVAIYAHKLAQMRFRDSPMTYAEAYQRCYGRPIEMRRSVRHEPESELHP